MKTSEQIIKIAQECSYEALTLEAVLEHAEKATSIHDIYYVGAYSLNGLQAVLNDYFFNGLFFQRYEEVWNSLLFGVVKPVDETSGLVYGLSMSLSHKDNVFQVGTNALYGGMPAARLSRSIFREPMKV